MSCYAKPGMIITGSDNHTCTAGAFNALTVGIDRTESAGILKRGQTWFKVPESMKIVLSEKLPGRVYAKDISLWIIGMIGSAGANYMSIEFHGEGVKYLSISEKMTLTNLASEMGAKNAVFPADKVLEEFLGEKAEKAVWADEDAVYDKTKDFQLFVSPASKEICLQMIEEDLTQKLMKAGANILAVSCGPCLGTGQGIPSDDYKVISTANRNFKGRMDNREAEIYLASPACVAYPWITGEITDPREIKTEDQFPYRKK